MGKVVNLMLSEGDFAQGFPVTLQVCQEGGRTLCQTVGRLPPSQEIPECYDQWQEVYRRLDGLFRLEVLSGVRQVSIPQVRDECRARAEVLKDKLTDWYNSSEFGSIKDLLLQELTTSEEIRLLVQTQDTRLRRLPWQLFFERFLENYRKAEVALSALEHNSVATRRLPRSTVRILAILGNSDRIDIERDRSLLEKLRHQNTELVFLVEPQQQEFSQQLWDDLGWDMLFFAGHSSSQPDGETGWIAINRTERIAISNLKCALSAAVERGLQLAIFNSCDGLGLARELQDLHIPQIIVMREPIPDRVAHTFLTYFLADYASSKSLYLAERTAREKLQGLEEEDFPCASWLPVIFQNPLVVPLPWDQLPGIKRHRIRTALIVSVVIAILVLVVRSLGILQAWELQVYDQMMRSRPHELPDPRILVVGVTQADIEQYGWPLSDRTLAQLLDKLDSYQPRTIGIDLYRDIVALPSHGELRPHWQHDQRLITLCKVNSRDDPGVAPPPEVPANRQGFSDVVTDLNGVIRRHLLWMTPYHTSKCKTEYAFSLQIALHYLATQGITPADEEYLQLKDIVFSKLKRPSGGYQKVDDNGYQILLNYRYPEVARQVSLTQVLTARIDPHWVKERVVLIGMTARSIKDYHKTPYMTPQGIYQEMPGVVVQAQMVSQILSAVLDRRSLLWVWPAGIEILWIGSWSIVGGLLAWHIKSPLILGITEGVAIILLYGFCFGLLWWQGGWVPLVPSVLALIATGGSLAAWTAFLNSQRQRL